MADNAKNAEQAKPKDSGADVARVPGVRDHDRVTSLSIRADGTPDQSNPELIGDPDQVREFTREQFSQSAVSAADTRERGVAVRTPALVGQKDGTSREVDAAELPQDPSVERLGKAHTEASEAARGAADAAVDALTRGKD